jgi:Cohesin domain
VYAEVDVGAKTVIGVLFAAGVVVAVTDFLLPAPPAEALSAANGEALLAKKEPGAAVALPERGALAKARVNLFAPLDAPGPKLAPVVAMPPEKSAPPPPPLPYRVAGQVTVGGRGEVLLTKGDRVFTARPGDMLDDGYRVEAIEPSRITLVYAPLGTAHHLPLLSALEPQTPRGSPKPLPPSPQELAAIPSGPAQLRWLGPEQVAAGRPFEVVLKLTSAEPVGSLPLELSYDAKLLEPVAVRAGAFFAGGKFSYRLARGGSILIGATTSAAAAADVDFVVVTFRAIRAGATAELKVASIELTNDAGTGIEHVPPKAFRTSIR